VTIKPVLYGGIAARLCRVRALVSAVPGLGYVFLAEGFVASWRRFLVKLAYRLSLAHRCGRVIFQNPDDLAAFVNAGIMKPQSAILIRGSGVCTDNFHASPEHLTTPLVVLPGRMLWDKGVGEFVQAAASLAREGVKARFALVGDTDPHNPAAIPTETLREWDRAGVVEWWGHRSDMPRVLSEAHIVCLPSYREGLPKALLEAAASGRPIVTADVPGCREIVRHDENGLLVPVADATSLATALRALIEDPGKRQRMGACGRRMVEREFSVDKVISATLDIYRDLLRQCA
jgi:glycosyltransferase involved in cell wall biosynthesis